MKQTTLLILLSFATIVHAQVEDSYLEDFKSEEFYEAGIIGFGLSSPQYPNGINNTSSQINTAQNYSWQTSNSHSDYGNSLKLTVHPQDHAQNAVYPRSRAEILLNLQNENYKTYYYSWKLFIPDDSEFIDDTSAGYHIINQILNTTYSNGSPLNISPRKLLTVQYKQSSENNDQPRDLGILLFDNDSSEVNVKSARINITDAIKKGEWNEFIYKIHWSEYSTYTNNEEPGSIEIFINRRPLVVQSTDTSSSVTTYTCTVDNQESESNISFAFPNMTFTEDSNPIAVPNYLKLGHYRNEHTLNHSLYIDDIRITSQFPPPYNRTKLIPESCQLELRDDFTIECLPVAEATEYVFRFEKDGVVNYRGNGSNTILDLKNLTFLEHNATYNVSARAKRIVSGITEFSYSYGESCSIFVPKKTTIKENYCDVILPIENLSIEAKPILNANKYVFRFENNGMVEFKGNGPNTTLDLSSLSFIESNKTYNVQVRAQRIVNGNTVFSYDYGDICQVTIPFKTKLLDQYCSITSPIETAEIEAYPIPHATEYIFQFESNGVVFYYGNGSNTTLHLAAVNEIEEDMEYEVKVRTRRVVNGITEFSYGYGDGCTILTPDVILFNLQTNIEEFVDSQIQDHNKEQFYPNPVRELITISPDMGYDSIEIYDFIGRKVYQSARNNFSETWNLSFLAKGIYFVTLLNGNNVNQTIKIIKE
jgi:hypothetical protein